MTPNVKRVRPLFTLLIILLIFVPSLPAFGATERTEEAIPAPASLVAPVDAQQAPSDTEDGEPATAIRNANLRGGPGTNYPVVGGATAGQTLEIVSINAAGDWYQLAGGNWIFGALVQNAPQVSASASLPAAATVTSVASAAAAAVVAVSSPTAQSWVLVADSAADFPGGRDRNNWFYVATEGRGNGIWKPMAQATLDDCYVDSANKGLEVCRDTIIATTQGDVGVQWKANRGGTYRFEWDSASLKFYKHGDFVGILDAGVNLPYATTVEGVIDWEMFFWVAADTSSYHIQVYRLDESAAPVAAAPVIVESPAAVSPAAVPAAVPASAPVASLSFGSGMKIVGVDIAPGTYRGSDGGSCYWERLRGFGGTLGDIIANEANTGPWIVTISASDKGFYSARCGAWTLDLSPITASPTDPFGSGTYFVGKDIAPGTWQSSGTGSCYWERLTGFSGTFQDLKANDYLYGSTVVTIDPGDQGFRSTGCGTWTRIN